nr:leucine-rich repeat protein [Tanacetum cinerariifolium]
MARLAFCDYHNMIEILEKYEHNQDFHQIVDFVEASHIRIETTKDGTKILATVDGKLKTVSESSIRRNLKLNDEAGISSLPDAELFENLTLMGYNISPNQKFTFQKGQFSHQWKYLIHTIMQCLSPKITGINDFSSNIATDLVCLATNRVYNFSKMIFDDEPASPLGDVSQGEAFPTDSGLEADQDRENIAKTFTLPSNSTPRVTSLAADEGNLQHQIQELTALCTSLKPLTKKKQREFYTSILRNQAGWKAKHFKEMTLEEIKEKFDPVWKQIQDFIPIGSKEESERLKRKGINLEQEGAKKVKILEDVSEEDLKAMMELVPVEEVYVEALQVKHPIIDWEVHTEGQRSYWKIIRLGGSSASYQFFVDLLKHFDREDLNQLWALVKDTLNIRPAKSDKEMELWVKLKRLYEPDVEDQLWTHTQNLMYATVEWKLYDMCRVHHVTSRDKEIFMLVEKDYPLRKGLAIVMISYKLQVENYSQMANDLILKIYKISNYPRQQED